MPRPHPLAERPLRPYRGLTRYSELSSDEKPAMPLRVMVVPSSREITLLPERSVVTELNVRGCVALQIDGDRLRT